MKSLHALDRDPGFTLECNWGPCTLEPVEFRPGGLVVVLGGTQVGKSVFAINLLLALKTPSVLYSLDTDLPTQESRTVSVITGVNETTIKKDPRGWTRVLDRKAPWVRFYEDLGFKNPADLGQLLKAEEELWGRMPAAIVVDNVRDLVVRMGETSYATYADCFTKLKALAQDYHTLVVALHHTKKDVTKRPSMSDGLFAGPDDAALVLGLSRENGGLWCSILKNRFGHADSNGGYGVLLDFKPHENMRIG